MKYLLLLLFSAFVSYSINCQQFGFSGSTPYGDHVNVTDDHTLYYNMGETLINTEDIDGVLPNNGLLQLMEGNYDTSYNENKG